MTTGILSLCMWQFTNQAGTEILTKWYGDYEVVASFPGLSCFCSSVCVQYKSSQKFPIFRCSSAFVYYNWKQTKEQQQQQKNGEQG